MAQPFMAGGEGTFADRSKAKSELWKVPEYQAYQILHAAFVIAPIVAGIDKFLHLLTNWDEYLAPRIAALSPIGGHGLMVAIGPIEIIAGLLVAFRPRIGAYVVMAWLLGIIINLLLIPDSSMSRYAILDWRLGPWLWHG
jgi:uncharacterized membrane protein HdeD (DUF308 family)